VKSQGLSRTVIVTSVGDRVFWMPTTFMMGSDLPFLPFAHSTVVQ
jgi:hypothetical protein